MTEVDRANRVVSILERWISTAPTERSVTVKEGPEGWRATMTEHKTTGSTSSLLDCLSQLAVVCEVENEERAG